MKPLMNLLIVSLSLQQLLKADCTGIYGLSSPVNFINMVFDSIYSSFDVKNRGEDVKIITVLQNPGQTRFKVILQIFDTNSGFSLYYIGAQSELRPVRGGVQHKIVRFVHSESLEDVKGTLKITFQNPATFNCNTLKEDFNDYYLTARFSIGWFAKYFKADLGARANLGPYTAPVIPAREADFKAVTAQTSSPNQVYNSLGPANRKKAPGDSITGKTGSGGVDKSPDTSVNLVGNGDGSSIVKVVRKEPQTVIMSIEEQEQLRDLNNLLSKMKVNNLAELIQIINIQTETGNSRRTPANADTQSPMKSNVNFSEVSKQLELLKQQLDEKTSQVELLKQYNRQELQKIKDQGAVNLQDIQIENRKDLNTLKANFDAQLTDLARQKDLVLQQAIAKNNSEITKLINQKDAETSNSKADKAAQYDAAITIKVTELQQQLNKKQAELQLLQQNKAEAIAKLQKDAEEQLTQLEIKKKRELEELQNSKVKEIIVIENEKSAELARIQAQKDAELRAEINRRTREFYWLIRKKDDTLNATIQRQNDLLVQFNQQKKDDAINLADLQQKLENQIIFHQNLQEARLKSDMSSNIKSLMKDPESPTAQKEFSSQPGSSPDSDDFYIETIDSLQFKLKQSIIQANSSSTSNQEMYIKQDRVVNRFINELSREQRQLIEDYLKELARMVNSNPVSIYSLTYDKILMVLDQIRIQQARKKAEYQKMRQKLLQEYLDRMNAQNSMKNFASSSRARVTLDQKELNDTTGSAEPVTKVKNTKTTQGPGKRVAIEN